MDYFKSYEDLSEGRGVLAEDSSSADSLASTPSSPLASSSFSSRIPAEKNISLSSHKTVLPSSSSKGSSALFVPPSVTSAPNVETFDLEVNLQQNYVNPTTKVLYTNPKLDIFHAPVKGPLLPHDALRGGFSRRLQNHLTGHVECYHVNKYAFDTQYHNYHKYGVAADPSDHQRNYDDIVSGNASHPPLQRLAVAAGIEGGQKPSAFSENETENFKNEQKTSKRRKKNNDSSSDSYLGPWAPYEEEKSDLNDTEENENNLTNKNDKEEKKKEDKSNEEASEALATAFASTPASTTIFHGKNPVDYQGRSWIEYPRTFKLRSPDEINYIPKKHIHTYVGHTMGVQAIKFFPESGHLLLSASMDGKVKIWDVYNQRKCLRTYMGHTQAVRDIQFTTDGRRFYSCSYDRNILLWDTEYGKVIGNFTNNKTPFCVSIHGDPAEQNVFIIGTSNKKAVQFDANSGNIVQEYNEHLGAVNTVTFCENNRKLVTTSDDKKIFIWEYGIPVVVKHIAEACMYSMPSVSVHPSKQFFAAQSMDNQIVVYEAFGRFRFQGKKRFRKHICAGYAIHPNFSSDGRFIMSGDVSGKLWFWDWQTMKNYRTLECHDGVCIDCAWHPTMTSRVASCGWDGLIKLWD